MAENRLGKACSALICKINCVINRVDLDDLFFFQLDAQLQNVSIIVISQVF